MTPEEVRASHLFKHVERVEDREGIYQLLRDLRARARNGADFDALALEHTDKEDKLVDLGWFKRGEFMEEFDLIIFSLDEGEVSPVFASHWGFHLAENHRPAATGSETFCRSAGGDHRAHRRENTGRRRRRRWSMN